MQDCLSFSDFIISPYSATSDYLRTVHKYRIPEDRYFHIPFVPTRFFYDDNSLQKSIDVCYIGSSKVERMIGIQNVIDENTSFFVSTIGRQPIEGNPTRNVNSYLRIMNNSALTIASFAFPPKPLALHHNLQIMSRSGAGRVAEAIACGCVPLFVYSSAHEMKLPFFLGDNVNTPSFIQIRQL